MGLKKFLVLVALFTTIFSTCNAAQVGISNLSAEDFLSKMTALLQNEKVRQIYPMQMSKLIRDAEGDMKEYNLESWGSFFAKDNSTTPEGHVIFLVDSSNYVHTMRLAFLTTSDWNDKYKVMLGAALEALELTSDEAEKLINGGTTENEMYTSAVPISRLNKTFVLIRTKVNDKEVAILMATDGKE